jgi:F-type H+-transporting ATPase subunit b
LEALGIDGLRLVWQIINFLILLFLLQRLLFKPILRLMDSRATKIRDSISEAERMQKLADEIREMNEASVEEAKKRANDMMNAATHAAAQMREQAAQQAREEGERMIERARAEIQLERDRAIADVRHQAVDLAILAAGKVIEQQLSTEQHRQLVTKFLDEAQVGVGDGHN